MERVRRALLDALDGGPAVLPVDARHPRGDELRAAMAPERPVEPNTAVVVPTSGSTGTPKGVLLAASALVASAEATHRRLGGPGRWLLATPVHYIGGLQVLVRAHLAGTEPVVLDLASGFSPTAFAAAAGELLTRPGPHYTALVPTQLTRILVDPAATRAAAGFAAIVIGGARLDPGLRARAERAGLRVRSAYGMSETASGCVYDGVPLDGVRVRIGTGAGTGGVAGRIEIAGSVLAHGYRLRPDESAATFRDGWLRTNDLGRLDAVGRLEVLGRVDDVINTGGVKVPAAEVERALTGHPAVLAACVVGVPDPEWGEAVAAAVVLGGGAGEGTMPGESRADDSSARTTAGTDEPESAASTAGPMGDRVRDELRAAVRTAVGAAGVPKRLEFVRELPTRGPGKPDRVAVRAMFEW
ncbi:O-succinylbenzoic acid--CoA ligase [Amycolatopsis arida]|uniref:O-succinylbenzoic acid--CoA ligase n=1 Tax=Amycolatopsis arida TaxID=587909 RepID=A0A1I6A7M3_9PSEU|nr:O-succinylbenzoic acid--CoA ligase [Amycolatopsis arida]SFQ64689.1 O-succinylbenzoic acid--CoA ligase [Amycolatopsis arida]